MSWGAVIAGGAALAGTVISSQGAKKSAAAASAASAESTEFAKQQYEDWKSVYGPIQNNLSSYYSNLSADYYATVGLENFEIERQNALEDLDATLAQRGIKNSGVATQLKTEERIDAAGQRAVIRRSAQDQVAQKQQSFLALGQGSNATGNYQNVLNQNTSTARSLANTSAQAAGAAAGTAVTALGSLLQTGLSAYGNSNTTTPTTAAPTSQYSWQNYV